MSASALGGGPDVRGGYLLGAVEDAAGGQADPDTWDHRAVQVADLGDGQGLDAQVEAFRTRPLTDGPHTFVAADTLRIQVREGRPVLKVAIAVATGVRAEVRCPSGTPYETGQVRYGWRLTVWSRTTLQTAPTPHLPPWRHRPRE